MRTIRYHAKGMPGAAELAEEEKYERRNRSEAWTQMPAKYAGRCEGCGSRFRAGSQIWWRARDKATRHKRCVPPKGDARS